MNLKSDLLCASEIFLLIYFWSHTCAAQTNHCNSSQEVSFNREFLGVLFDPYVSYDRSELGTYQEDELKFFLEKVFTKFSRIMFYLRSPTKYKDLVGRSGALPITVAKINKKLEFTNILPLKATILFVLEPSQNEIPERIKQLDNTINSTSFIFPGTIQTLLVQIRKSTKDALVHFLKFREIFQNQLKNKGDFKFGINFNGDACLRYLALGDSEFSDWPEISNFLNVPIEIVYFNLVPYTTYLNPSFKETANLVLELFEDCKKLVLKYNPETEIGLVTSWPDTNENGNLRKVTHQFSCNKHLTHLTSPSSTSGWWRLIPNSSYETPKDFQFEDKTCLEETSLDYPSVNLNWLKEPTKFNRDFVGVTLDLRVWKESVEKLASFEKTGLAKLIEKIGSSFSKVMLYSYTDMTSKQDMEAIGKANIVLGSNSSVEITQVFLQSNIEELVNEANTANALFPGTIKNFAYNPMAQFSNWKDHAKTTFKRINETVGAELYSWGVVLMLSYCSTEYFEPLAKSGAEFFLFWGEMTYNTTVPVFEQLSREYTALIEICKKRVEKFNTENEMEAFFITGWPTQDNSSSLELIHFWEFLNTWAKRTQTNVYLYEAFDNPSKALNLDTKKRYSGWWRIVRSENGYGFENKKEIALKLALEAVSKGSDKSFILEVALLLSGVAIFLLIITSSIYFLRKRRARYLTKAEIDDFFKRGVTLDGIVANGEFKEIGSESFQLEQSESLGSGAFGNVCKGSVLDGNGLRVAVAVKMTKQSCARTALKGLLSEIKILAYLGPHPNVIGLIGAYTAELRKAKAYVFLEICEGSLEVHLRKIEKEMRALNDDLNEGRIDPSLLIDMERWSLEIANGMEFIASKSIVHMDLATRNVLLDFNKTAKISDFGLSRRLYHYQMYVKSQQEPLPWRWMAPESLKRSEFTEKSDVWAFGVTLWEIYSLAELPFPGLSWDANFANYIESGLRLGLPKYDGNESYSVSNRCWATDPKRRPSFSELITILGKAKINCGDSAEAEKCLNPERTYDLILSNETQD